MQQKSALLWASDAVSSLLFGLGTHTYSQSPLSPFLLMCVCMYLYDTCVHGAHGGQKKLMESLAARVTYACELPDVGAGN